MSHKKEITFGKLISTTRIREGLNLTDCAARIYKDDGTPISVQYLSDIEKERRNPPSEYMLKQISTILNIPIEVLYFYSETFPSGLNKDVTQEKIIAAFQAFFEILGQNCNENPTKKKNSTDREG